jgi:NodT family efflux transporter outer membrane factor (OMF) lipoprotein
VTYERDERGIVTSPRNDEDLTYNSGFSLSYEIDLFGRVRNGVDAARADAEAAAAALQAARITVAGETARAYADICAANQQIAVTENTLDLQARTVDLTRQLTEGGQGTTLDIARARVNVENTRASLPRLRAARENARFRLATLVGTPPSEMVEAAAECMSSPIVASTIPVGDGAGLIARRPDVQEAEKTLAASAARVGVATAELYPRITLGGSVDVTALQVASLKEDGAVGFNFGPLISWSFPNQTAARARIRAAEATMAEALARFDQAVLVALQETETALQNYAAELERQAALKQARDVAAQSARMARERYELGADDFITVLDAERTLAEADITLAQSQASTTQFQIELFRALGGTWDAADISTAGI